MQHTTLTGERWQSFTRDQQLLMIANEMNRAAKLLAPRDRQRLLASFERVLQLVDLTIGARLRPGLCRELLRWRDLVAEMYISPEVQPEWHQQVFRALLLLTPATARQIPFLLLDGPA